MSKVIRMTESETLCNARRWMRAVFVLRISSFFGHSSFDELQRAPQAGIDGERKFRSHAEELLPALRIAQGVIEPQPRLSFRVIAVKNGSRQPGFEDISGL